MSTISSLVSSSNFPLLVVAVGFVLSGVVVLGASVIVSLRTRTGNEE